MTAQLLRSLASSGNREHRSRGQILKLDLGVAIVLQLPENLLRVPGVVEVWKRLTAFSIRNAFHEIPLDLDGAGLGSSDWSDTTTASANVAQTLP